MGSPVSNVIAQAEFRGQRASTEHIQTTTCRGHVHNYRARVFVFISVSSKHSVSIQSIIEEEESQEQLLTMFDSSPRQWKTLNRKMKNR